ncbi:MAG TPA: hypothetical protein VKD72_21710 [Gemmataceae bacterium]|nr:hypothetical protein [Gemmataceae bacterium]
MDRAEVERFLRQKPFQPFRVFVSDGRTYEVRNPRMNLLAESFIKIGIPDPSLPEPICDHTEFVWLKEIVRIEPLAASPPLAS